MQRQQRDLAEQDVGDLEARLAEHAQRRELARALGERDARRVVGDAEGERARRRARRRPMKISIVSAIVSLNFSTAARRSVTAATAGMLLQLAKQLALARGVDQQVRGARHGPLAQQRGAARRCACRRACRSWSRTAPRRARSRTGRRPSSTSTVTLPPGSTAQQLGELGREQEAARRDRQLARSRRRRRARGARPRAGPGSARAASAGPTRRRAATLRTGSTASTPGSRARLVRHLAAAAPRRSPTVTSWRWPSKK